MKPFPCGRTVPVATLGGRLDEALVSGRTCVLLTDQQDLPGLWEGGDWESCPARGAGQPTAPWGPASTPEDAQPTGAPRVRQVRPCQAGREQALSGPTDDP